jgi:methionyl-tRNA synthetase
VIDPLDVVDVYGVDPLRFYLFRAATFGQDGSISVEGLHERYERELGNDLGNLLSRTTAMIARYRGGELRVASGSEEIAATVDELGRVAAERLDRFDLTGALETIWALVRRLNRYVEQMSPWELAREEARTAELDGVLYDLADGLRATAVALAAFVPETSARILAVLRQGDDLSWTGVGAGKTSAVTGIEAAEPLFPRVDAPTAAA